MRLHTGSDVLSHWLSKVCTILLHRGSKEGREFLTTIHVILEGALIVWKVVYQARSSIVPKSCLAFNTCRPLRMLSNRRHACDFIGRQFLHIFIYFCIWAAFFTVRPILQAHFEVRCMHLASTLYYAEIQLTYLYKKGMLLVGSLLVWGVWHTSTCH